MRRLPPSQAGCYSLLMGRDMADKITITLPDDLRLLIDEARGSQPLDEWILDACWTHLKLKREGLVYRKPLEGEQLEDAVLEMEAKVEGLE